MNDQAKQVAVLVASELAKDLLTLAFTKMAQAGMSEAEQQEFYNRTKAEFLEKNPADLPEVH
jgi:phosphoribosyl-AMP cyclohydrolase